MSDIEKIPDQIESIIKDVNGVALDIAVETEKQIVEQIVSAPVSAIKTVINFFKGLF